MCQSYNGSKAFTAWLFLIRSLENLNINCYNEGLAAQNHNIDTDFMSLSFSIWNK